MQSFSGKFLIVAIIGQRGTGKSTLSRIFRQNLKVPNIPIGSLLARDAKKAGKKNVGEYLKDLERESPHAAVQSLTPDFRKIASRHHAFVVEGLHRPQDYWALKKMFPNAEIHLVSVQTPQQLRILREMKKRKVGKEDATKDVTSFDEKRNRLGLKTLESIADQAILTQGKSPRQVFNELNERLRQQGLQRLAKALRNAKRI